MSLIEAIFTGGSAIGRGSPIGRAASSVGMPPRGMPLGALLGVQSGVPSSWFTPSSSAETGSSAKGASGGSARLAARVSLIEANRPRIRAAKIQGVSDLAQRDWRAAVAFHGSKNDLRKGIAGSVRGCCRITMHARRGGRSGGYAGAQPIEVGERDHVDQLRIACRSGQELVGHERR